MNREGSHRKLGQGPEWFTPTEQVVYNGIWVGFGKRAIAKLLGKSSRTVETHINVVKRKLGARNTADVVRAARRIGDPVQVGAYIRFPIL